MSQLVVRHIRIPLFYLCLIFFIKSGNFINHPFFLYVYLECTPIAYITCFPPAFYHLLVESTKLDTYSGRFIIIEQLSYYIGCVDRVIIVLYNYTSNVFRVEFTFIEFCFEFINQIIYLLRQ